MAARPKAPAPKLEGPVLRCVFRTEAGNEPVREWLRDHVTAEARKTVGEDILTVQRTWPIGKPLVDSLGDGLREVKTKKADLEVARSRKAVWENKK